MNKLDILRYIKNLYGNRQNLRVEDICPLTDTDDFSFRLREITDDTVYYIEMLVKIIINDIELIVIAPQEAVKVERFYNQTELTNILFELQERAIHIIKQTQQYEKRNSPNRAFIG